MPAAGPSSARRRGSSRCAVRRTAGYRKRCGASPNVSRRGESRKMLSSLDLLHLARAAASRAAAFVRSVERPADTAGWRTKQTRDFVTDVDRTAERMIAEVLLAGDPRAAIVGEELSPAVSTGGLVWIVDPLDGTTNFLHGYPMYAVSVAAAI